MDLILIFTALMITVGYLEKKRHRKNIKKIPIRINVNGIRGKSTVTRLITGILVEAGYRTIGKTTGTSARMIFWNSKEERPIKRRPEGPNISEQMTVIKEVAKLDAEVLVSECMAVNPDYQITFQKEMLQANIGVIVNVLEDHMDVMGPTLDQVADAFVATIPYNGHLIVSDNKYVDFFKKEAAKRRTTVIVADNSLISESFLRRFDYMVFPENAALALAVAKAMGIKDDIAFKGMLNAHPDPGAMRIIEIEQSGQNSYFVNGFAANDAASTLNIWKRVKETGYSTDDPIVIMNCRADRVDRTEQFAKDVLPYIKMDKLVLIGETTSPIVDEYNKGKIKANELLDLEDYKPEDINRIIQQEMPGKVVYGVGNIHGAAEPLVDSLCGLKIEKIA